MNPFRDETDFSVTVAALVILSIILAALMLMVALL